MTKFDKLTESFFDEHGRAIPQTITFYDASKLTIQEGDVGRVRLFVGHNDRAFGWWFSSRSLGDLIAQLCYLKQELDEQQTNREEEQLHDIEEIEDEDDDWLREDEAMERMRRVPREINDPFE